VYVILNPWAFILRPGKYLWFDDSVLPTRDVGSVCGSITLQMYPDCGK
jgi:hypothetical protein